MGNQKAEIQAQHSAEQRQARGVFGFLQDGKYPNGMSLSADLEVSLKTAGRDIEFMRDRWSLPIDYDDKRHGFVFTEKVERLRWVPVTEAELFAVCISQKALELYHGMPFQTPLELAFVRSPGPGSVLTFSTF